MPKGIDTDATEEEVVVPNDQQDLIDGLLSDEPVEEEVQEEEEVVEEEAVEEKPEEKPEEVEEEKPESEEEPKVEEEKAEEEVEEESSEKEEEDEITGDDPLQAALDRNEQLADQIIAMAEQGLVVRSPEDVEEPSEEEVEEETEKPEPIKFEELKIEDFLTEDELDRVNDHPELMNEAFGRAMKTVMEQINTALKVIAPLQEEVRALPKQVSSAVGEQMNFNTFVNSFYNDNPDLTKASKVVYMQYRGLLTAAQKEGKKTTIGELYNQAGDEVRVMLSIPKEPKKSGEREPALPGAKTPKRRQKSQKASGEAKTQAELMAYLTSD